MDSKVSKEAVCVIIPTLRRPEHLARCLASLVPQKLKADEVLVGIRARWWFERWSQKELSGPTPVRKVEAKGGGRCRLDELLFARSWRRLHCALAECLLRSRPSGRV